MSLSISTILSFLETENLTHQYYGNNDLSINSFCPISELRSNAMTWIKTANSYDFSNINLDLTLLIITDTLPKTIDVSPYNFIITDEPKVIYFEILNRYFVAPQQASGIATSAIVETHTIGRNVSIGHHSYIGAEVSIGDNVIIRNNVVIEGPTTIGSNCVIESGTVIGAQGYGYYTTPDHQIKKVPDFGGVIIGNRVEIGANVGISRGTLSNTVLEDDVKIDNLCHIGHNAHVGARTYITASSMLAGSCTLEEDTYLAPGSLIMNQITVGKKSFVGMGAAVTKSVEANKIVAGVPAKVLRDNT
ncbi:MAG: hypothetical protein FWG40_00105 [Peptococcaceae bacterium]|nr:hypothetical protein [Peptococcaceae bacterium]